jgi:Zn-dependent protease/predicted transcriptional regulator
MFGRGIHLFRLFGFSVKLDWTWSILAILVTWSLAVGLFPALQPGLTPESYWIMGAFGALGLFFSIVFHEFFHALVARMNGIKMRGITLFLFGGVAEMAEEPPSPRSEFLMTIAGPISSFFLGGFFLILNLLLGAVLAGPVSAVIGYLGVINIILAVFNMIPAFPLDGGRILRSALWAWKGDVRWATKIASNFGSAFGILLIVLGVLSFLRGNLIGGLWWFVIGIFVRNAAASTYQHVLLREVLQGEPVRNFMRPNPVVVSPHLTLRELVEDYVYRHHFKMFPVVEGGLLLGRIDVEQLKDIPREEWDMRLVRDHLEPMSEDNTLHPNTDAMKAFTKMQHLGTRLLVAEGNAVLGILAMRDMIRVFALKMELEEGAPARPEDRDREDQRAA